MHRFPFGTPLTTVGLRGSNIQYNKIEITFSDWMIVENIISRKCDNHIPRNDIFDYRQVSERNIYIIFPLLSKGDIFLFYKFDKFEIDF